MLDDGKFIHDLDKSNALGIIAGQTQQLLQPFEFTPPKVSKFKNIVLAGMGGSALAAEFLSSWLRDVLPLPIQVVRDYDLPAYAGIDTLAIISSYSGNTQETLSALASAKARGASVVVMSSGGKLAAAAAADDLPYLSIPSGFPPRLGVFFEVKALAVLLERLDMAKGITAELEQTAEWLSPQIAQWTADSPTSENRAKQIAREIFGCSAVIYAGPALAYAAKKWKIDFNENAKNVAFYYELPEFCHNEFTGWIYPQSKLIKVIELHSGLDRPEIQKRFEISNRLLSGKMPSPQVVRAEGETKLQQMLWTTILGDFTSAYLAFLNGVDPTPVELIEKLKQELT